MPSLAEEIASRFEAGQRWLKLETYEERRAIRVIDQAASELSNRYGGPRRYRVDVPDLAEAKTKNQANPLAKLLRSLPDCESDPVVTVLCDLHRQLGDDPQQNNPEAIREIRRQLTNHNIGHPVVLVGPPDRLSSDLAGQIVTLSLPPLADDEILDRIDRSVQDAPEATRERIIHNLRGLPADSLLPIVRFARQVGGNDWGKVLRTVWDEKQKRLVDEPGILRPPPGNFRYLGGWDRYLDWLQVAAISMSPLARGADIPIPRGALILGPPGTGKSIAGPATADRLGLPLLQLDLTSLLDRWVGSSEERMRRAIRRIDQEGPCCLFIDEADKLFGGVLGDATGVTSRLFALLLEWMSRPREAFVVMTMNRLAGVPIESIRAGRLSAVFCTTMPTWAERRAIFRLKLSQLGVEAPPLPSGLRQLTTDWTGAEIEEACRQAVRLAWANREVKVPRGRDLLEACSGIRPVARLADRDVAEMIRYCRNHAEPVSNAPARRRKS